MPIKYQALGSGGLTELTIKTSKPNTTVTITKENFEKVLVSDDSCLVVCKLAEGVYQVKSETPEGEISQKEIVILNQEQADLRATCQVKNLSLGAKLKFSSGKKFYLKAKNVSGHEANSATFISEFIIENVNCSTYRYENSPAYGSVLPRYYNELNGAEKNAVIFRSYTYYYLYVYGDGGRYESNENISVSSYFYIMSRIELGLSTKGSGSNLGFTDYASRIMKYEDGSVGSYWTRDGENNTHSGIDYIYSVGESGDSSAVYAHSNSQKGVAPAVDLKGDTLVSLDTDGYWVITE